MPLPVVKKEVVETMVRDIKQHGPLNYLARNYDELYKQNPILMAMIYSVASHSDMYTKEYRDAYCRGAFECWKALNIQAESDDLSDD